MEECDNNTADRRVSAPASVSVNILHWLGNKRQNWTDTRVDGTRLYKFKQCILMVSVTDRPIENQAGDAYIQCGYLCLKL